MENFFMVLRNNYSFYFKFTRWHKFQFLVLFVYFLLALFPIDAFADRVIVGHPESFEYKTMEMQDGQTVNLIVHLKSSGVMLEGYKVALRRDSDRVIVASIISDVHGLVKFSNLGAGKYTVLFYGNRLINDEDRVQIGDLILERAS